MYTRNRQLNATFRTVNVESAFVGDIKNDQLNDIHTFLMHLTELEFFERLQVVTDLLYLNPKRFPPEIGEWVLMCMYQRNYRDICNYLKQKPQNPLSKKHNFIPDSKN